MSEIMSFDPKLMEVEEEVIQYLINSNLFYTSSLIFRRILGYFITRKTLTQEMLKELTHLSTGKISQELKKLYEMNFISRTRKSSTDPYIYSMKSVDIAFINDAITSLQIALDWEEPINKIYEELEDNSEELNYLNGYNEITHFLEFLKPLMGFTKGAMKEVEELKDKFKKLKNE